MVERNGCDAYMKEATMTPKRACISCDAIIGYPDEKPVKGVTYIAAICDECRIRYNEENPDE